ncbi:MAG: lysophospholipid acyltransferase family protein [Acidobacteriales bacterium]|nr:lysophospholipid acyltransferase family protein [Terriglobales bacterium]
MKITVNVDQADLAHIPSTGATIVVSNHPFGMLDGIVLGALALRVRPDAKILANFLLASFPALAPHFIFVDPFNRAGSKHSNAKGLRQAIAHLRAGGMLIVFPGGEVSHWQFQHGEICDPQWTDNVARLAWATEAPVLPVLFNGSNSLPFHLMGLIHPILRTVRLPREFLNKRGKQVDVCIGNLIPAEKVSSISDPRQAADFLRWRTYLLGSRQDANGNAPPPSKPAFVGRKPRPIVAPAPQEKLLSEVQALGAEGCMAENREFAVYEAKAGQIPYLLGEIGRQREVTFREVGEGTGKAVDIDRYDSYYTHLILWSKSKQELAGAYRLANTEEVLRDKGIEGLYTSSLFNFEPAFFQHMGAALELGRSFVRSEYQKQYGSLLMLWKGIGAYVARHPQTPVLFGAVSVSNSYKPASRELMVEFFKNQESSPLANLIEPKSGFRQRRKLRPWEISSIRTLLDTEELSGSIAEIEEDGKGLPILLKQYLKVGGKVLGFNVDKHFSNSLDGLILVDLRQTEPTRLENYMSKPGYEAFRRYHRLPASQMTEEISVRE